MIGSLIYLESDLHQKHGRTVIDGDNGELGMY